VRWISCVEISACRLLGKGKFRLEYYAPCVYLMCMCIIEDEERCVSISCTSVQHFCVWSYRAAVFVQNMSQLLPIAPLHLITPRYLHVLLGTVCCSIHISWRAAGHDVLLAAGSNSVRYRSDIAGGCPVGSGRWHHFSSNCL
jgi:hypothetical protein